jgi:cation diffusion facilitator CzcD-associated flavoprotein CzcO
LRDWYTIALQRSIERDLWERRDVTDGNAEQRLTTEEVERRYQQEMAKRLSRGERHYQSLRDLDARFDADPYAEALVREPIVEETDVVVVGSGWAGMSTAAYLTKQGVTSYRIIDKAGDFGGTWYWNRYPGCMCDVESYTYLPLLEEVGYMPTKKYAHAQEIFEYAQRLGRLFDMYPHAMFHTEVIAAVWQEDTGRWLVTTSRGDQLQARFVVICGGVLHKAKLPGIPGIERFAGHSFHTSRWDYGYTGGAPEVPMDQLGDKVVGIIGTGATAVQTVPKLAAAAKHLYVFQRTPSTVSPRNQRDTDPEWFREISSTPGWHEERMANFVLMTTGGNPEVDLIQDGWTEMFKVDVKKEPRDAAEAAELKELDRQLMDAVRQRIADTVKDPATAKALMPWYGVSCKRPCYHDDYLPTFNRDNVTLVDTDGNGVEAITERGVVAEGVEYPLDCLVYATGFDAPSTFYTHRLGFDPIGKDGQSLSEAWAEGAWTLHGVWSHGFPNLCMNSHIQGGQHINIAYAATKCAEHTAYVIRRALDEDVTIEPDVDAEQAWYEFVVATVGAYATYFTACTPGYLNNELATPDPGNSRSACYMRSATDLRDLWSEWRQEGNLLGLVRSPARRQ